MITQAVTTAMGMPTPASLTPLQLIDGSRQGLSGSETGRVAGLLGVTDKEMARLLNQSVATFHWQVKIQQLDAATSERLLLLTRLATYGATVFQDKGKFTRWSRTECRVIRIESYSVDPRLPTATL